MRVSAIVLNDMTKAMASSRASAIMAINRAEPRCALRFAVLIFRSLIFIQVPRDSQRNSLRKPRGRIDGWRQHVQIDLHRSNGIDRGLSGRCGNVHSSHDGYLVSVLIEEREQV